MQSSDWNLAVYVLNRIVNVNYILFIQIKGVYGNQVPYNDLPEIIVPFTPHKKFPFLSLKETNQHLLLNRKR